MRSAVRGFMVGLGGCSTGILLVENVLKKGIGPGRMDKWRSGFCSDDRLIDSVGVLTKGPISPASKESSVDHIGIAGVASFHSSHTRAFHTDILLVQCAVFLTARRTLDDLQRKRWLPPRRTGQVKYCRGPHLIASNNLTVSPTWSPTIPYTTLPDSLSRICSRPRPASVAIPAPKSQGLATSAAGMNLSQTIILHSFTSTLTTLTTSHHKPRPDPYPAPSTKPTYRYQLEY